jgi:hypothetical protein
MLTSIFYLSSENKLAAEIDLVDLIWFEAAPHAAADTSFARFRSLLFQLNGGRILRLYRHARDLTRRPGPGSEK